MFKPITQTLKIKLLIHERYCSSTEACRDFAKYGSKYICNFYAVFQWGKWKQSGSGTETLQAPRGGYRTPSEERGGNPLLKELLVYVHAYIICKQINNFVMLFNVDVIKKGFVKKSFLSKKWCFPCRTHSK